MQIWTVLRPVLTVAAVVVVLLVLDRVVSRVLRRLTTAHPEAAAWPVLRRCRVPFLTAAGSALLLAGGRLAVPGAGVVRHVLLVAVLVSCGWLAARMVALLLDTWLSRYSTGPRDPARVRRVRTQASLLGRVCGAGIAVVTLAAVLMTFPAVRSVGTSLLASAGIVGLVLGVAAQSTLGNLFAGLQLAFSDMVGIDDVVVVAGEWGKVEEITLTYVAIATWDQRRIVMPVSYFVGKPFENWSRRGPGITGTAVLHLDHSTPVGELRAEFERRLDTHPLWDGTGRALQVVDTTPSTIVVRALMTARNADDAFELRCWAREELIRYLRHHHPAALPRLSFTEAPATPEDQVAPMVAVATRS
ncbi:mechanosensitive ion channel family protein [Kitasatospora sp. NPDC096147]|uniref:mechanosensitive ion channel family protein n=1 Tax=Kitasatospora sp. NPDC096147 TaxID=3364093 RepID=UPI003820BF43